MVVDRLPEHAGLPRDVPSEHRIAVLQRQVRRRTASHGLLLFEQGEHAFAHSEVRLWHLAFSLIHSYSAQLHCPGAAKPGRSQQARRIAESVWGSSLASEGARFGAGGRRYADRGLLPRVHRRTVLREDENDEFLLKEEYANL